MTTTRLTLLAAVALAGALTACTTSAATEPTSSTTSVSASSETLTTTAAIDTPTSTSGTSIESSSSTTEVSPPSEASGTTETASTTEAPSPVEGFGLVGQDLVDAQAAWGAYQAFRTFYAQAAAEPGSDWSAQLSALTGDPANTRLQLQLTNDAKLQSKTVDKTVAEIVGVQVQPDFVVFSVCVDASQTKFYDKDGNDVTAPDAPGSYYRHPGTVSMDRPSGTFLFVDSTSDYQTQC